jgi:flagellar basal-body rod modification protein FlgD
MAVDSVGAATSAQSKLNLQDFLKILLTQLTYQDPLKPWTTRSSWRRWRSSRRSSRHASSPIASTSCRHPVGHAIHRASGQDRGHPSASGTLTGQVTALDLSSGAPQLTVKLANGQTLAGVGLGQVLSVR